MKHDNSEWTEEYPFIDGTLCDKDGNEISSHATRGALRCVDVKPTKPGDYCVFFECVFSAYQIYAAFDGEQWDVVPTPRNMWWFGGEPAGPLNTLSRGLRWDDYTPRPLTLSDRLAEYKSKKLEIK